MIGEAPAMQDVFRYYWSAGSRSSISVLINGESGTGKAIRSPMRRDAIAHAPSVYRAQYGGRPERFD